MGHHRPSRDDVRLCRDLVAEIHREGAGGEDFLEGAAELAGGVATVLRPPPETWARAMPGTASGLTLPFPGGWLTIVPDGAVAHDTIFGHEAAHIVFGDVPHWDRARPATHAVVRPLVDTLRLESLVGAATSGRTESVWRHDDSPSESRAELVGTLLASRRLRPLQYVRDRVDGFFAVRGDR